MSEITTAQADERRRRYPQEAPKVAGPSARGASMFLLSTGSKSDKAAYALMFRQLAATAKAIHDMHQATGDLRRVRAIAPAVIAATKTLEASALAQPMRPERMNLEKLREQHPGMDEETLRARLFVERTREGVPMPTKLRRGDTSLETTEPARRPGPSRNQPDIER